MDKSSGTKKFWNFCGGPSVIPDVVKEQAKEEFLSVDGSGHSMFEFNHRSPPFYKLQNEAKSNMREFLEIPDDFEILFFQGGSHLMFNSIGFNLFNTENPTCMNVVTGWWSFSTGSELSKYGTVHNVLPHVNRDNLAIHDVPAAKEWNVLPKADFVHYCDNETGTGFEFNENFPYHLFPDTPIVSDMSSNIGSKPIDWSKYGAVYACAQKNLGPTGVTVLIVRKSILKDPLPITPTSLSWKKASTSKENIINTPDVAAVYMMNLQLRNSLKEGGLPHFTKNAVDRTNILYNVIDESAGFYHNHVHGNYRSRMNVVFRVGGGNKDLEKKFITEAKANGFFHIGGHHSVGGGSRISVYNSMPTDGVVAIAQFMKDFAAANRDAKL